MWWIVWLWLAAPRVPVGPPFYPPDESILLQKSDLVELRWGRPGRKFLVRFYQGDSLRAQVTTSERVFPVSVEPGGSYRWTVQTVPGQGSETHQFTRASTFEYHADGRSAIASSSRRGMPGTNGAQLTLVLERDLHGMNLYIQERRRRLRYLFCEPGLRFLITARGGNGGPGSDGVPFSLHPQGYEGGSAGWGGNLRVLTRNAPWREYLDLDVRAGQPGPGGRGAFYMDGEDIVQAPDGPQGRSGQGGRVDTLLEPRSQGDGIDVIKTSI